MCGIHGFFDSRLTRSESRQVIGEMMEASRHRGPDATECWQSEGMALGHNRLSIIDLSDQANQPMLHAHLSIVFNGEIYNYREIREELVKAGFAFRTSSDTEVILAAYLKWGRQCVNHFEGMWAFAIWDAQDNSFFCSRDRFGIKPFHYIHKNGRFYFSSEIKSLKKSPVFQRDLNLNQVARSLQLGWVVTGEETIYEHIKNLSPGCNLTWKNGQMHVERYWQIQPGYQHRDTAAFVEEFRECFNNSLLKHLRSDVPVGATLSGGIDSSAIVCSVLADHKVSDFNTFSVYYEGENGVDERPFVNEIISKYKGQFSPNFLSPDIRDVEDEFYKVQFHADFPILGSSPVSQYFVMKAIGRSGIKVILSGQGADDYLGGYMHSYYRLYADYLAKLRLGRLWHEWSCQKKFQRQSFSGMMKISAKSLLSLLMGENKLYDLEFRKYFPFVTAVNPGGLIEMDIPRDFDRFGAFHYALMNFSSLPSLLHYEDRNSMAASIESRVPFLDHRLVELAFSMPSDLKIKDGYTKWVLREAMKDVLPEKIRYRTDKKGFVTPGEVVWLRGGLKHLLELDYSLMPFLKKELCEAEISAFRHGDNRKANLVWRLASLNFWMKYCN